MSNKHVLCQLNVTHLHFSIDGSHQRQKMMVLEILEVGKKKMHESKRHPKNYF